ncbi:glycosyltransferase [Micrococcus sp.]|uniref:glycosyltransferase n=1 Tax=Micrococcus sp. TaxID=1271 RepID=UPI002A91C669|nr:glycosyltransferase [Micrococcus sp.]MDY6054403.1 glycosyltransferase [Micrococcus sp.]
MRIVFSPESYNLGETTRCIEVAGAARAAGHETSFHVYSDRYLGLIEEAGHAVRLGSPVMTPEQARQVMDFDQGRGISHPFDLDTVRRRVSGELAAIHDADAAVIGSNPTMFISARAGGVPLFYVRPYYMSRSYFLDVDDGYRAPGPLRWAARLITWKPKSLSRVAAEYGVRLPGPLVEAMTSDVDLIASLPPALDRRPLDCHDVAVGPVHYRSPAPLPAFLEERDAPHPLVYVSFGSSGSPEVLGRVLAQLDATGIDLLVGGGVEIPADVAAGLSDRVHRVGVVSEHRLRGRIDAAVIHGGEGTVQAACLAGVPFAGYPMQAEQRWNVDECVRLGNALRLRRSDVTRGRMPDVVRRLLTDGALRRSASGLSERMAGLDGPARAVSVIERVVADGLATAADRPHTVPDQEEHP